MVNSLQQIPAGVFMAISLWSLLWKAIALWRCVKKEKKYWFIAILVLNTAGILPIAYLIIHEKKFLKDRYKQIRGGK